MSLHIRYMVPTDTVNFYDMPNGNIADKFLGLVRLPSVKEIGYLSIGTHNGPIFSRGFTTCVAAPTLGSDFAGLSHYDLRSETEDSAPSMLALYQEWNKKLEVLRADEGASQEEIHRLTRIVEGIESDYQWTLANDRKRISPSEYIPQMLKELRSNGEEQGSLSVVVGGTQEHIDQVLDQLSRHEVTVLGTYMSGNGIYTHMRAASVNFQKQQYDQLELPERFDRNGTILVYPSGREILINDSRNGLVNIQIVD